MPPAALDWPSYAAGRTRGLPWFLLAARLVASAGYPVLLHGWNGPDGAVRAGLPEAGIAMAQSVSEAAHFLARDSIVYLPLETLCPQLFSLLGLREVLGLRSCINTVCRMLDPGRAGISVQGVFHPSYRLLQADAAEIMGWRALSVIKGGGGEVERHPGKTVAAFGLREAAAWEATFPTLLNDSRRLTDGPSSDIALASLWSGGQHDPFAEAVVIGTAALALDTLGLDHPEQAARALWRARHTDALQEISA